MRGSEHQTSFFRVLKATIVAAGRSPRSASLTGCPHQKDPTCRIGYPSSVPHFHPRGCPTGHRASLLGELAKLGGGTYGQWEG
jgi:hypothetical protein